MASRLARSAMGVARLRPTTALSTRTAPPAILSPFLSATQNRFQSNVPAQDPKGKAQSILDSVPGSNLASKTAVLSGGAGLGIYAISNEIYVLNEESIILLSMGIIFYGIYNYAGPMYTQWAQGYTERVKGLLNSAREEHTKAVQARIDSVKDLGGVVDITKSLFEVSKETAKVEAEIYELEQKTALAHEARQVLDSWVRYEGNLKARQQKELAESIIAKIDKELQDPKVLKQILDQSVKDIERILQQKPTAPGSSQPASS